MAAGDGLISMTPTSIAYSGTSASINADGGVDFSAVTSLSLNGVFVSGIDNYLIVISTKGTALSGINGRLRSAGTDATGTDYATARLQVNDTIVQAAGSTSADFFRAATTSNTAQSGDHLHIYAPYLAQPTAARTVNVNGDSSARIFDAASTHSLSTSYDGITFLAGSGDFTGNIHVFGYEE